MSDLITTLKTEQIIPDIIPPSENFTPKVLFTIIYKNQEILPGTKVPRSETLEEPDIKITPLVLSGAEGEGEGGTYTLVMTDPDAPSRSDPKYGEWRHWVITGLTIPSTGAQEPGGLLALKPKPASTPYHPPGPPPGTGYHRYTFLLFQEPKDSYTIRADAAEHQSAFEKRRKWHAMNFAKEHGLKLVGATFFLCKADE